MKDEAEYIGSVTSPENLDVVDNLTYNFAFETIAGDLIGGALILLYLTLWIDEQRMVQQM